jgi:murein DD-endopeptidase MepM/ murein hydrolase activator NlpD
MNLMRIVLILVTLVVLPGSCIATQLASQQAPKPTMTKPPIPKPNLPRPQMRHPIEQIGGFGRFLLSSRPAQGSMAIGQVPAGTQRLVINGQDVAFDRDGKFLVAFGRDHDANVVIAAYRADGQAVTERMAVAKRAWKIENLTTVRRQSQPDAEFQARRPGELAQINAARSMNVASNGWRQSFTWPAKGRISGLFGSQRIYAGEPGAPHSGVDIAGGTGAPVMAPADGVVTLAATSPFTLEGHLIILDHGMGLDSSFLHLSRLNVKKGDVVKQGQVIGAIGATGRASGPHLHWGMKWKNERIDPLTVLDAL